jgi:hypothetical protein
MELQWSTDLLQHQAFEAQHDSQNSHLDQKYTKALHLFTLEDFRTA